MWIVIFNVLIFKKPNFVLSKINSEHEFRKKHIEYKNIHCPSYIGYDYITFLYSIRNITILNKQRVNSFNKLQCEIMYHKALQPA